MAEHPDKQKWLDLATKQMKGKSPETLNWKSPEGIVTAFSNHHP